MDPPKDGSDISLKAGNMILNRSFIDEEAGCESSGVYFLNQFTVDHSQVRNKLNGMISKGMGYYRCFLLEFKLN